MIDQAIIRFFTSFRFDLFQRLVVRPGKSRWTGVGYRLIIEDVGTSIIFPIVQTCVIVDFIINSPTGTSTIVVNIQKRLL